MTIPSDLSHDRIVNALVRAGFSIREGAKHTVARKEAQRVTVPRHRRIKSRTVELIVQEAGLTPQQFLELL